MCELADVKVLKEGNSGRQDLSQELEFGNILNLLFFSVFLLPKSQVLIKEGGLLSFRFSGTLPGTY